MTDELVEHIARDLLDCWTAVIGYHKSCESLSLLRLARRNIVKAGALSFH
jgi:hypothetical protein